MWGPRCRPGRTASGPHFITAIGRPYSSRPQIFIEQQQSFFRLTPNNSSSYIYIYIYIYVFSWYIFSVYILYVNSHVERMSNIYETYPGDRNLAKTTFLVVMEWLSQSESELNDTFVIDADLYTGDPTCLHEMYCNRNEVLRDQQKDVVVVVFWASCILPIRG